MSDISACDPVKDVSGTTPIPLQLKQGNFPSVCTSESDQFPNALSGWMPVPLHGWQEVIAPALVPLLRAEGGKGAVPVGDGTSGVSTGV